MLLRYHLGVHARRSRAKILSQNVRPVRSERGHLTGRSSISYLRVDDRLEMSGQPMLKITIPPGLGPGQKLMCKAPDGQQLQVTIPPNVRPGQQIQIAYKPLADQPAARGSQGSTPLDVARMRQISQDNRQSASAPRDSTSQPEASPPMQRRAFVPRGSEIARRQPDSLACGAGEMRTRTRSGTLCPCLMDDSQPTNGVRSWDYLSGSLPTRPGRAGLCERHLAHHLLSLRIPERVRSHPLRPPSRLPRSNVKFRILETEVKTSKMPSRLTREQAEALLRCFEVPMRRVDVLERYLEKRLQPAAAAWAEGLMSTRVTTDEIRNLCGDPME